MCQDPEVYPDPSLFNPERYLCSEPQQDPRKIVFGFGRRICPGMFLAEASIFSCIVSSLAVFSIEKALNENGVPITPVHESTNGILW
jgi:cytochrome P450